MNSTRPDDADFHATGHVSAYDAPLADMASRASATARFTKRGVLARLATFGGLSLLAFIVVPAFAYPLISATARAAGVHLIAYGAMSVVAMLAATALTVRWFGDSWSADTRLGLDALDAWAAAGGVAAGSFAIALPCVLMIWGGALVVESAPHGPWWSFAMITLVVLAPAALAEELTFRGYAFSVLERGWGTVPAIAVTSLAFGAAHLLNPGVSGQAIAMVVLAGAFLALIRLAFNSLWTAWLAHLAYNFVQGAVFHTAVSGLPVPQASYRTVAHGPVWLTGGAWGPEAGAAAALGMLGVSFGLALYAGWLRIERRGGRFEINWRPTRRGES